MKSEPSLLLPVYVTHIVMHYASPSPLDAPLVEWKSRVFSSTPVSAYSDGRTEAKEEEKARKWHKWPHYFPLPPLFLRCRFRASGAKKG